MRPRSDHHSSPPRVSVSDACVWFQESCSIEAEVLNAATDTLSSGERDRASRFHFSRDRRDYVAAHALTRELLSRCDGRAPLALRFAVDERGKPVLLNEHGTASRWEFSLSHTHGLVVCGVAIDAQIGVDVEALDRTIPVDELSTRHFTTTERARLRQFSESERARSFLEIWTLKEALLKAVGVGLNFPLNHIAFDTAPGAISVSGPREIDPPAWSFTLSYPSTSHVLAVATRGIAPPVIRYGHASSRYASNHSAG